MCPSRGRPAPPAAPAARPRARRASAAAALAAAAASCCSDRARPAALAAFAALAAPAVGAAGALGGAGRLSAELLLEHAGSAGAHAVSCPGGFGALLDPKYFEVFGAWQSKYGRDSLRLSAHFLSTFQQSVEPVLEEAMSRCAGFVLETMMNAVLHVETEEGADAARQWLRQVHLLRDQAVAVSGRGSFQGMQLATLIDEWSEDVAVVYPKLLGLEHFGPAQELQAGRRVDDLCAGQRFFVYDLGEQFYKPGNLYCLTGQWGTEVVMRHFWKQNCNTDDPQTADWFFVSLFATCMYVKLNENFTDEDGAMKDADKVSDQYIWEPLMNFLRGSKYYQRKQGKDHIFLFADGQGPRIWDSYDLLRGDSVFMSPESKCPTWDEPVRRYLDVKSCLTAWKDIIIPGHTDFARIQFMRKKNRPLQERQLLMTFHGRAPDSHAAYGDCAVRGRVMDMAKFGPHVDVGGFVEDYPERKGNSYFCLVPAGTSPWTNHLYESFYAGCIPVILSDEYEVAFLTELDWPSFSIKWPEADVGDALHEHLSSLARFFPDKIGRMKENLERNACWFNWYSADPDCNPYVLIHRRLRGLLDRMAWRPRFWNCDAEVAREDEPPLVFAHLRRPTRFKHSLGETSNFTWLRDPAL